MYRASLVERQALAVGQDYRLVPVSKRGGIFHPKCIYLAGPKEELLLIGSGNLTFGGHGNNVEAIEVLSTASDPQAFADFGAFLESAVQSQAVRMPHDVELRTVSRRLARFRRVTGGSSARVVHSVDEPIRDQLVRAATGLVPVSALLVLSPYHHPDGAPLRALAEELRAKRLIIGVPTGGQPSSFPFQAATSWKVRVEAAQPNVKRVKRPLHAKWWELRTGRDRITMVGSVNATRESFETTNNVEVAVLRGPIPLAPDAWSAAEKPGYVAAQFFGGGDDAYTVFATLSPEGVLSGCVMGPKDLEGKWRLQVAALEDLDEIVPVEEDGAFKKAVPRLLSALDATQITMRMGPTIARGWLNFDLHLSLSTQQRAVARAIERLLARDDTDDDVEALLGYIASESAIGLRDHGGVATKSPAATHDRAKDDHVSVPTESLLVGDQAPLHTTHHIFQSAAGRDVSRLALLLQVTSRLLAAPRRDKGIAGALVRRGEERHPNDADGGEEDVEAQLLRGHEALGEFNRAMSKSIGESTSKGRPLGLALCIWLNVNLAMNVHRFDSAQRALHFVAAQYLPRILGMALDKEARGIVGPSITALSGFLASNEAGTAGKQLPSRSRLRQWIEEMPNTSAQLEAYLELAGQWLASHPISAALGMSAGIVEKGMRRILSAPTPKSVVLQAAKAFDQGISFAAPGGVLGAHEATLVAEMLRAPLARPRHIFANGGCPTGCPKCYLRLDSDAVSHLRHFRIGECLGCKSIILWIGEE